MTISSELTKLQTNLTNAYTAIDNKGGTIPANQNFDNLATCIDTISGGGSNKLIKANYWIDVDGIVHNVATQNGSTYILGANTSILNYYFETTNIQNVVEIDLSAITEINSESTPYNVAGLGVSLKNSTSLTSADLSSLTTLNSKSACQSMFSGCTSLTSVDLSSLTTINFGQSCQYMFLGCTSLTSVDLSSLVSIEGARNFSGMFSGCTSLTSVDLSSLVSIKGNNVFSNIFKNCTSLTTVNFPLLSNIKMDGIYNKRSLLSAFNGCTALTDVYFNSLISTTFNDGVKDEFTNMLGNTGTNVTHTLHFPSNLQNTISSLEGYPLFGGDSGYVVLAFDLPATS